MAIDEHGSIVRRGKEIICKKYSCECGDQLQMASPNRNALPAGAVDCHPNDEDLSSGTPNSAKGPVSRILSCAVIPLGAASPRTLISDLPGGFAIAWSSLRERYASNRAA